MKQYAIIPALLVAGCAATKPATPNVCDQRQHLDWMIVTEKDLVSSVPPKGFSKDNLCVDVRLKQCTSADDYKTAEDLEDELFNLGVNTLAQNGFIDEHSSVFPARLWSTFAKNAYARVCVHLPSQIYQGNR